MKYLLLTVFIATCLSADAQRKKAPATEFIDEPVNVPDENNIKAGIRQFRQVDFSSNYGATLDPERSFIFRFDTKGRLLSSREFGFGEAEEAERAGKIRPPVYDASQISYKYDAAGNVISMKTYDVVTARMAGAATRELIKELQANRRPDRKVESTEDAEPLENLKGFAKSIRKGGKGGARFLKEGYQYSYNADGNILTQEQSSLNAYTRFNYKYDKAGRVTLKRSVYRVLDKGGAVTYYSSYQEHFTYTQGDKPTFVSIYNAENDTGDIATERYLVSQYKTHYNAAGDPDTVFNLVSRGGPPDKQITAYIGRLPVSLLVLYGSDTSSFTMYTYKGARLAETLAISFAEGKRVMITREVTDYNSRNLPVEHTTYKEDLVRYSPDNEVAQSLFFYGNAAEDRQVAERQLREQTAMQARRKERAKKDHELREQSEAHRNDSPAAAPAPPAIAPVKLPAPIDEPVLRFADTMPRFNGDLEAFMEAHLRHPDGAETDSVERQVVVLLTVRRDGSVTDASIIRTADSAMDEEALKMIRQMPKWVPGSRQGQAVSVYVTLPIVFRRRRALHPAADIVVEYPTGSYRDSAGGRRVGLPQFTAHEKKLQVLKYDNGVKAMQGVWTFKDDWAMWAGEEQLQKSVQYIGRITTDLPSTIFEYKPSPAVPVILYEGPVATWYRNGNRRSLVNYHNGVEDGPYEYWYYYGNKAASGTFRNGIAVGDWVFYHVNGSVSTTVTYDTVVVPRIPKPAKVYAPEDIRNKPVWMDEAAQGTLGRDLGKVFIQNKILKPVRGYYATGKPAYSYNFVDGRKEGTWQVGGGIKVIYQHDSVIAFYDDQGHDIAADSKYFVPFQIQEACYGKKPGIDSSGPEPVYSYQIDIKDRAHFPGGEWALKRYLKANLRYPKENVGKKEGEAIVYFTVQSDGTLSHIHSGNDLGYGLDEEAIRLVQGMPRWKPAVLHGKNVASYAFVNVTFTYGRSGN